MFENVNKNIVLSMQKGSNAKQKRKNSIKTQQPVPLCALHMKKIVKGSNSKKFNFFLYIKGTEGWNISGKLLNKLFYFCTPTIEIFLCFINISIFELYFYLILKVMNTNPSPNRLLPFFFQKLGGEISRWMSSLGNDHSYPTLITYLENN